MIYICFSSKNRIRSTILGQRKPKSNKRKKKKRTQRRYSEGEASDYDENNKSCGDSDTNGTTNDGTNRISEQRDSGVDFGESGDDNSKKSMQKCSKNIRIYKKPSESNQTDDIGLEMEFKSGMMFDIEM